MSNYITHSYETLDKFCNDVGVDYKDYLGDVDFSNVKSGSYQ